MPPLYGKMAKTPAAPPIQHSEPATWRRPNRPHCRRSRSTKRPSQRRMPCRSLRPRQHLRQLRLELHHPAICSARIRARSRWSKLLASTSIQRGNVSKIFAGHFTSPRRHFAWLIVLLLLAVAALSLIPITDAAPNNTVKVTMQNVAYKGWKNNLQLTNGTVELILTLDIGPRVMRYGFVG